MRIVFNAHNLVIGGGLSVGLGVIQSLYTIVEEDEIHIFLPRHRRYNFLSNQKIKIHYLPRILTGFLIGRLFINWYLSYKVWKIKPDGIFSMGNYAIPSHYKQLLLLQWPYAVYPESIVWQRMTLWDFFRRKIRQFIFQANLKYAIALTVQTHVMKERVEKYIKFKRRIYIVESSSLYLKNQQLNRKYEPSNPEETKLLFCLSEYYSHKNLEIFIPLAELIKNQKLNYQILITIHPETIEAKKLLRNVEKKELNEIIINLGRIQQSEAITMLGKCDALLMPTLLESYGLPYLEAAQSGIPIFTSDLDFAHDMNGDGAWYFNPLSAENILQTIQNAFNDPKLLKEKADKAFQKASKVKSWEEITGEYLKIIKSL